MPPESNLDVVGSSTCVDLLASTTFVYVVDCRLIVGVHWSMIIFSFFPFCLVSYYMFNPVSFAAYPPILGILYPPHGFKTSNGVTYSQVVGGSRLGGVLNPDSHEASVITCTGT